MPEAGRVTGGRGLKLGQEKGVAQTLEWEKGTRLARETVLCTEGQRMCGVTKRLEGGLLDARQNPGFI